MTGRHTRSQARVRRGRLRLLVVAATPLVVLAPLTAGAASRLGTAHAAATHRQVAGTATHVAVASAAAGASHVGWSKSWTPPLALLSNYRPCCRSKAGFKTLSESFRALGSQTMKVTVTVRTRWVDTKARLDSPNIVQEGLYESADQVKLQIRQGSAPSSHRAECRVKGVTGSVMATGPAIDVANGQWHTITCVKSPDGHHRTKVVVIVDGVAGRAYYSHTPIGKVAPPGKVDLGGRSAVASSDSLDGWIRHLTLALG
jgi:hypothetical protein